MARQIKVPGNKKCEECGTWQATQAVIRYVPFLKKHQLFMVCRICALPMVRKELKVYEKLKQENKPVYKPTKKTGIT